jgi:hypothetical protein
VALGVSLVVSVNISAESMNYNIKDGFSEQLGHVDIMLKENRTTSSFDFSKISDVLDTIPSVESYVSWLTVGRTVRTNPSEDKFGSITINNTFPEYQGFDKIEQFLALPGNSCVISLDLAELYNLSIGDSVYIPALNMVPLGQIWGNTSQIIICLLPGKL